MKPKILIIEGADRVGKTTFIETVKSSVSGDFPVFCPDTWNSDHTWEHIAKIEKETKGGLTHGWMELKRFPLQMYNMVSEDSLIIKDRFALSWRVFGEIIRPETSLKNAPEIQKALELTLLHYFDVLQLVITISSPLIWYDENKDKVKSMAECCLSNYRFTKAETELPTIHIKTVDLGDWHTHGLQIIEQWLNIQNQNL